MLGCSVWAIAACAAPALAQADNGSALPAAGEQGPGEIIVTARKRAESIVDNPTSVSVLTQDDILSKGITGYRQLNNFVPNFRWQTQNGTTATRVFNSFVIRGIAGDSPDRANVSVFMDGVPVGGGGSIPGLTDVTQVEVVKGPQSAYFGRSTFAGAINFVTAPPSFDYRASVDLSLGSRMQREMKGSLEGPVIRDLLAVRVSARHNSTGVFDRNFGYGGELGEQQTDSYSVAAHFTPAENFSMRAYHTGWRDHDAANATAFLMQADYNCNGGAAPAGTLNYICGEISRLRTDRISQNTTVPARFVQQISSLNILGPNFIRQYGLQRRATFSSASFTYKPMDGLQVDGNLGYVRNRFAQMQDSAQRFEITPGRYAINLTAWDVKNKLGELRVSAEPLAGLNLLAGFNYFWQAATVGAYTFIIRPTDANPVPSPNIYRTTTTRNLSGFGAISYNITQSLEIDLEGRYQVEKVNERGLLPGNIAIGGTAKKFVPRAIVKYSFAPQVNAYGSYSLGTRGPVPNTAFYSLPDYARAQVVAQVGQVPTVVPEEQVEMYEVGLKGEFFDRRLRILAAGYWGTYRNRQIGQTVFYTNLAGNPAQAVLTVANGVTALSGIELQANLKVSPEFNLEGSFGYSRSEIRNTFDTVARAISGQINPVGNRTPFYPAYTASGSASYRRGLTPGADGYARIDYIYTGRIYADATNLLWLKPSHVVNLAAGVEIGNYTFEVWGRNVLNNKVPSSIARTIDVYTATSAVTQSPQERPSAGMRVSARF